ncbi:UNVERIFIED_CONTAM: hypothetical protein Sradi_0665100 [Sesamum radiatum]|uniref:Uncharacterized protein n=1 Tax=Sesamum radiatum TaxID=300843 RepID=A0AAW2VRF7_SESRA
MACTEQFLAQGYPPDGEEPTFLDLGAAMENAPKPLIGSSLLAAEDLPQNLGNLGYPRGCVGGGCGGDERKSPVAVIESKLADAQPEGTPARNEGETPRASDEAIPAAPLTALPPGTQSETKEDPACGDKK